MLVIFLGFLAGIIGGMGIGGGTILIPSLVFFVGVKQQVAQSVSLLSFIPAAIVALVIHFRHKSIEKKLVLRLILFGCIGTLIGAFLAVNLNSELLKKGFGIFLFIMGIYELTSKCKNKTEKEEAKK